MIRGFGVNRFTKVLLFARHYNAATTGPKRPGNGYGDKCRMGNAAIQMSEPQLVAKLLELFPVEKSWVPVSKWAQSLSDEVKELLVAYDGLGKFVSKQSNFFIVRTENGVKMVSLTTMGVSLCQGREKKEKFERMKSEKFSQRRDFRIPTSSYQNKKANFTPNRNS
ncbi:unnamed protein product [Phytomonas sp. EM1]|nr:unnamed protein product [Phytomonas sp. EM1]|eukprot:CCW62459.1 unnamed protein product [Phytomonas sp. isolate EM1]